MNIMEVDLEMMMSRRLMTHLLGLSSWGGSRLDNSESDMSKFVEANIVQTRCFYRL